MFDLLASLSAVLKTTPMRWQSLVDAFPESLLKRQPASSEWSALECLQHLIDLDRSVFPKRVRAILAGENFPAFFPDNDGSSLSEHISPAALAAEFAALREQNLTLLEQLTPADLEKTAVHAELGPVTLGNLLHEWGGHDLMHLVQAEQAMMQPFIAGCGAWQVYFEDHVVVGKE
jgi:hypothetical protein